MICPVCGSDNIEQVHFNECAAYPEGTIPVCQECLWEGEPE